MGTQFDTSEYNMMMTQMKLPTWSDSSNKRIRGLPNLLKEGWKTEKGVSVFDEANGERYIAVEIMGAWVRGRIYDKSRWTDKPFWENEYAFYMCATKDSGKTDCWKAVNKR